MVFVSKYAIINRRDIVPILIFVLLTCKYTSNILIGTIFKYKF